MGVSVSQFWECLGWNIGNLGESVKNLADLGGLICLEEILEKFKNLGDLGGLP